MLSFLTRLFGRSADQPEPISSNPEPISEQIAPEPVAPVGSSEIKTPFSQTADSTTGEAQRSETPNRPKYEDLMSELLNRKLAVKQAEDDLDCGGGVHINGGPITVGGDIVGRDRIVVVSDGTINRLFEPLLIEAQKIEPETLHAEARQTVHHQDSRSGKVLRAGFGGGGQSSEVANEEHTEFCAETARDIGRIVYSTFGERIGSGVT